MGTIPAIGLSKELFDRYMALAQTSGEPIDRLVIEALERTIDELEAAYAALAELKDWRTGRIASIPADEARTICLP